MDDRRTVLLEVAGQHLDIADEIRPNQNLFTLGRCVRDYGLDGFVLPRRFEASVLREQIGHGFVAGEFDGRVRETRIVPTVRSRIEEHRVGRGLEEIHHDAAEPAHVLPIAVGQRQPTAIASD